MSASSEETCRVVDVDGVLVRVHSGRPTQADVASLSVILQAAERRMNLRRRAAPTTRGEMMDTQLTAVETNPNRPTEPGYCARCGYTPCLWLDMSQHYTEPRPLTVEQHNHEVMIDRIDALTDSQRRDALVALSWDAGSMDSAIRIVTR